MHAEDAFFRNPLGAFFLQKFSYSMIFDVFQISNFTHAVFCAIALIQVLQPIAGKYLAIITEVPLALSAKTQATIHPCLRPIFFGVIAAMTGIIVAQMPYANPTIHPARSD
jgi:hypothetical protein